MKTIEQVQNYWDEFPCGIQVTDKEVGSNEFFEEIKTKFHGIYAPYAHSEDLLRFRDYKDKAVLEVGCGIGLDALEFARHGADVTAIDISAKNVELARKYFAYHGLEATIEVGNAEELGFANDTFDLAVAIGVLYYTPNTQKAVDELRRVLKPGGKAISMFFNRHSWYVLLAKLTRTNIDHEQQDPPVLKLYSRKQVEEMFTKFSHKEIVMDRFPTKTIKRTGILAFLYNDGFVPMFQMIPTKLVCPMGFHIIVKATK